jgi:hypothetical protein
MNKRRTIKTPQNKLILNISTLPIDRRNPLIRLARENTNIKSEKGPKYLASIIYSGLGKKMESTNCGKI